MKKKEIKKLVKYITKKFVEYRHLLDINNWQIRVDNEMTKFEGTNSMSIKLSSRGYTGVHISWGEGVGFMWKEKSLQELDRFILHELCHVLINDLSVHARDRYATEGELDYIEERLCDNLSTIIHRLL